MNLEIIAEGIETAGQYDILKKEGCDQGQGFLMGKPLPVDELLLVLDSVIIDNPEIHSNILQKSKVS